MNKKTISAAPDENKMEELLGKIQPVPSELFHQKMKQANWRVDRGPRATVKNFRLKFAFAVITFLLLSVFFVTPQGRAWAQEVAQFFRRINSMTIELPVEQRKQLNNESMPSYDLPLVSVFIPTVSPEMVTIPGCETPPRSQSYHCQVALAESKLGF